MRVCQEVGGLRYQGKPHSKGWLTKKLFPYRNDAFYYYKSNGCFPRSVWENGCFDIVGPMTITILSADLRLQAVTDMQFFRLQTSFFSLGFLGCRLLTADFRLQIAHFRVSLSLFGLYLSGNSNNSNRGYQRLRFQLEQTESEFVD